MEIAKALKVMVSGYALVLMFGLVVRPTAAAICAQGKQYLNRSLETCVDCTECAKGDMVLRPCEIHRDTICGPISELFHSGVGNPHHRHQHHQQHHRPERIVWRYGDEVVGQQADMTSTEAPFSSAETLVWDWQAIALTSAVLACILFFLAMAMYSLHQAKQWRRLKDTFDADVEELSARLSLMASTPTEKNDSSSLEHRIGPISDGNYLNNRCVYLEQLLNGRKDTKMGSENGGGNVYIEESGSIRLPTPPHLPRTS